jgi:hypothetical protein
MNHPRMFPEAVRFAIEGYHFEKVTRQVVAKDGQAGEPEKG